MTEFLEMGGYAAYVWPSYGLAALVLVANVLGPVLTRRKILSDIARKARRARREKP